MTFRSQNQTPHSSVARAIIPAAPGYLLLGPDSNGRGEVVGIWSEPILAFFIDVSGREDGGGVEHVCFQIEPIVVSGVCTVDKYAIQSPDGQINICEEAEFESRDALLKHWKEKQVNRGASR